MHTTVEFLADVRREASLSTSAPAGTADADLLAHGTHVLRGIVAPLLRSLREEYYTRLFSLPVTQGQAAYRLPKRAVGCAARTAEYLSDGGQITPLSRVEPEQAWQFQPQPVATGWPWAFYVEGSRLVLINTPSGPGTLRVRCQVRPGALVLSSSAALAQIISGVDYNSTTADAWAMGISNYATLGNPTVVDIVAGTPPYEHLALDGAVVDSGIGPSFVSVLGVDFSSDPAARDWVALPDTTPLVQAPPEAYLYTVACTAERVMRALGRTGPAKDKAEDCKGLRTEVVKALSPRTQGQARKLVGGTMRLGWRPRFW